MNKQEAIGNLTLFNSDIFEAPKVVVLAERAIDLINQIDEPQKPAVPRVALEYYEEYKDTLTAFDEWFGDFYDGGFLAEFPQGEKLAEWLYDNDNDTNRQRELALATLIANGPSAVEVEKEKRYRVSIADNLVINDTLTKNKDSGIFSFSIGDDTESELFTKAELEQAGFGWVFDCEGVEVQEVE